MPSRWDSGLAGDATRDLRPGLENAVPLGLVRLERAESMWLCRREAVDLLFRSTIATRGPSGSKWGNRKALITANLPKF
jgi:hypothetical protein